MGSLHDRYHSSNPGTRTCCNIFFLIVSVGSIVLIVLGLLCLVDNGIGYCTFSTLGGFISLLVTGAFLAIVCSVLLCCICCARGAVERI